MTDAWSLFLKHTALVCRTRFFDFFVSDFVCLREPLTAFVAQMLKYFFRFEMFSD